MIYTEKASSASTKDGDDDSSNSDSSSDDSEDSGDEDDSEGDISIENDDGGLQEEIPLPATKILTESDDEYEIPLPPGPPPYRPFEEQLNPIMQQQNFRGPPPPPPPGGPFMNRQRMQPPPPPPIPHGFRPPQMMAAPPPPPPIMPCKYTKVVLIICVINVIDILDQQFSAPVHYQQPASQPTQPQTTQQLTHSSTPVISAEPQLRDLEKETLAFVPAAIRRKQNAASKKASLPKEARPHINAAP